MTIAATFWSFAGFDQYVAAIPYTQNSQVTGPYLWSNQGVGNNFAIPSGAPGCRVGNTVSQFLMLGDLYQYQQTLLFTGTGSQTSYSGTVANTPMNASAVVSDAQGLLSGTVSGGVVTGSGYLSSGTVNYSTGAVNLQFSTAPPSGDNVYLDYTWEAPYRVWWSEIGNPTGWPTPLTQAAYAAQSGYNDLEVDLGPVMFIAGYPLYGLIFQRFGITRAQYIGGNTVWAFQTYERKRGCIAHGAAIQVASIVYFLADDGWYYTDGANVVPIGTAPDNSSGIDKWFWSNVNTSYLETIRAGYDASKRCIFFSIPTGTNTLPDTLLTYNLLSQRWTRAPIASECLWTADNGANGTPGTTQLLGLVDQTHTPNNLTGTPLTGYLESCDLFFNDNNGRLVTGVRPQIACTDTPVVVVGSRNALTDSVAYSASSTPDPFARIAPVLQRGIYNRVRVQSATATNLQGATMLVEKDAPI
jgi:hypothetical protein